MTDEDFIRSPTQFCSIAVGMIVNGLDEWFRASQGGVPGVIAIKPAGVLVCSLLDVGRHRVAGITPQNMRPSPRRVSGSRSKITHGRQSGQTSNTARTSVWKPSYPSRNSFTSSYVDQG